MSAVVANLYMEHFEQLTLESAPSRPRLWKRYVDDICCIIRSETVEEIHQHINSIRPSIQFTAELESDGVLPFLDTYLQRKGDGGLDISVYRKPTHTDHYLHFQSHHPGHVKRGLIKCLCYNAEKVTSNGKSMNKERKYLSRVLYSNG